MKKKKGEVEQGFPVVHKINELDAINKEANEQKDIQNNSTYAQLLTKERMLEQEKMQIQEQPKVQQKVQEKNLIKKQNNGTKEWWEKNDKNGQELKEIGQENDQRIGQMSQEEIKSAVDEIYKSLPPQLIERLKNMGKGMIKKENVKIELEEEEEVKNEKTVSKNLENEETKQINEVQEKKVDFIDISDIENKEIFINRLGEFKLGERENLEGQSLLISDVLKITEDTDLEQKYFSSNDLVFLLHSSYIPHRILSLSITENFLIKNRNQTELIKDLLIEKDILDAGFTILSNLSGVTPLYQLRLFGLLNLLLQIIYPSSNDEFELIQTTSADLNTQSKIWIENQIGSNINFIKQMHDSLISKYEIIETCVSFISTQYGQSKKSLSDLNTSTPESDLCNIFVKVLEKLLLYSREGVSKIITNSIFVPFCRALFLRKETYLLIILSKASRESASMVCTVSESLLSIKEEFAALPSHVIKALSCYHSEKNEIKQQLLERLVLVYNLKVTGKSKFLFKADTCFAEVIEILKLSLLVLKHNSIDIQTDKLKPSEICKDPLTLKIIVQTLCIIKYDVYQNCKEWVEEKIKKFYSQISTCLNNIFDSLINDTEYCSQIVTCESLIYHIFVLSTIQTTSSDSTKIMDLVKVILENSSDKDCRKACLYLIRKSMCKDVSSIVHAFDIFNYFYRDSVSSTLSDKFYWYPLKVILINFLHNSEMLQNNCESYTELTICHLLMQYILPRDEYALMTVINILFAENETLKVFFLGYCINNEVATNVSKPFYDIIEPANHLGFKKIHKNPYIPIDSEWFIKPIMFSKKAKLEGDSSKEDQLHSLSTLFTEIFKELKITYFEKEDNIKMKIYGELSKYQIFHLGLSYVCHAYLQNKEILVTDQIVECLSIFAEHIQKEDAKMHLQDTKISQEIFKENVELAIAFLNTFYHENCSEYVTKAIMHFMKKEFKMDQFIKYHLQDIWHCIEDTIKEYESN